LAVSKVEVVVLGLLAEDPLYGYQLLERFRERSMSFWVEVGRASVYQTLERLERAGLVAGRTQEGAAGPDRRVYRLGRAGRARLEEGLAERFAELAPFDTGAGTALGFLGLLTTPQARKAVDAREVSLRDLLDALRTERGRTTGGELTQAMLARQEALALAELDWLRDSRQYLTRSNQ
jgi:PadR family transcriptional regulator PadR